MATRKRICGMAADERLLVMGYHTCFPSLGFVQRAGALAEAEGHHPDIAFGWGYATVSLQTKKIKGLHENDFIMAAKLDGISAP